jgi:hypothetical protein
MHRAAFRAGAAGAALILLAAATPAGSLLPGAWPPERMRPILEKTMTVRLAPDLSALDPGERLAVRRLLEAGRVSQHLYEDMLHRDAARVRRELARATAGPDVPAAVRGMADLHRLNQGPIVTTLDNERLPILGADSLVPGRNVYPWGVARAEIDAYLERHPAEREEILDPRTAVRRADTASLRADLATLRRHPALDVLHPGLAGRLRARLAKPSPGGFYAVPYAVAYADTLLRIHRLLHEAADAVRATDPEFAGYLRLRARDLLANDYEGGDAAWVTGSFGRLNAEIGAYETYDDELYGVKAFPALSLLVRDAQRTGELRAAIRGLQDFENSLPYQPHKRVREDIPVGIYDVVADFGQSRGTNTASILPNESEHARRYGRTILLRRNIMADDGLIAVSRATFEAAVAPEHHADFDPQGGFYRTLWHEIGHYLGPDRDRANRELDLVLAEESGTFEEMKADLVSLFVARELHRRGHYDDRRLRGVHASGILRTLQKNRPRPDQVYQVMQLMQFNWYLDRGLLTFDPGTKKLSIHYQRYDEAVASLLAQVLEIQLAGDLAAARSFIERWTAWDERHQALADAMRASETSRFRLVRYAALGE